MIPVIRDLSPESRDLLQRQITALFPESGIAGLYTRKTHGHCVGRIRLEIHCAVTKLNSAVAYFASDLLLVDAMPALVAQMQKCRAGRGRNKRAARQAA